MAVVFAGSTYVVVERSTTLGNNFNVMQDQAIKLTGVRDLSILGNTTFTA